MEGSLSHLSVLFLRFRCDGAARVAAGALALGDAVRLVRARGRFMQEATPPELAVTAQAVLSSMQSGVGSGIASVVTTQAISRCS